MPNPFKDNFAQRVKEQSKDRLLRSYNWHVLLPQLDTGFSRPSVDFDDPGGGSLVDRGLDAGKAWLSSTGIPMGDGADKAKSISQDVQHRISLRVASVTSPFGSVANSEAPMNNKVFHYAGKGGISTLTMDIYEGEDALTLKYLLAWKSLMINSNGTYNPPAGYKRTIKIYRVSQALDEVIVQSYNGAFIESIADTTSDYESSDFYKYSVSFAVDDIQHDVIGIRGGLSEDERTILSNIVQGEMDYEKYEDAIAEKVNQAAGPGVSDALSKFGYSPGGLLNDGVNKLSGYF